MPPRRQTSSSSLDNFFTQQTVSANCRITERMYQGFGEYLFEGELRSKVWKMDPNMSFGGLLHEFLGRPDAMELRKIADHMIAAKKSLPPDIDFKYPMQKQKLWEKLTDMTQSPAKISRPQDYVRFIQLAFHLTRAAAPLPPPPTP
ncbi:MAG TPA: hypothetical protein PKW15_07845 [Alphaproteobacteria bacterium]|nr:hypothetical protein [Alphaproteobacteria bacterium]